MPDKLADLRLFIRIAQRGAIGAAGRELGLSPATSSARLRALEESYGVRLLQRTTRSVSLTDEGKRFFVACERLLADLADAEGLLRQDQTELSGHLHITAPSDLGRQHVSVVVSEFSADHPDARVLLHLSDDLSQLAAPGFDIAVRYGALPDSGLVARWLGSNRRVLCASPDYLARHGVPHSPTQLPDHRCLVMVRSAEPLALWHLTDGNGKRQTVRSSFARASNDGALIRTWCLQGAGIALKSHWDVAHDLRSGRLVEVLPTYEADFASGTTSPDIHAVYPSRHLVPKRVRAFLDALVQYFGGKSSSIAPN